MEKEIVRSLKNLAKKADEVVIATDFDREGELIGSDASGLVRDVNRAVPIKRARFSAITKDEIERAFTELGEVYECLAQAGEARQDIDLVWGAVLTRYLTKVQVLRRRSAAKRRSRADTDAQADRGQGEGARRVRSRDLLDRQGAVREGRGRHAEEFSAVHETERFKAEADARRAMDAVTGATKGRIADATKTTRRVKPPTPFNTTALQAAAAAEGLSPARTMRIAESLYMDGLISYPRVDNTVYPPSLDLVGILRVLDGVPAYHEHAGALLRQGSLTPTRGSKETTDHPPIHPTGAADPDKLKPEEWKLYNLIARRFMATLSSEAVLESTKLSIVVPGDAAAGETFVARGDVMVSPGFRSVYPYGMKKEEVLPVLSAGDEVDFRGADMEEKQTKPPARYSQGALIQEMEKRGLGTKATRHNIIQTLQDRRYIVNDPVEPTCLGITVIDALATFADRITTPDMTSELEAEMDAIANGRAERRDVVDHSRQLLAGVMDKLLPKATEVGDMLKNAAAEDARVGTCPKSGHDLLVKSSPKTQSQFVGCAGWPECDVTYPLPQGKIEPLEEACPECGTPQVKIIQFRQKPRIHCLDPACPTNYEPEVTVGTCATCAAEGREGELRVMRSPRTLKRFVRCTNYETCNVSYPLPQNGEIEPTGEVCEPCGAPKVIVHTRRGPWKICIDPAVPGEGRAQEEAGFTQARQLQGRRTQARNEVTRRGVGAQVVSPRRLGKN